MKIGSYVIVRCRDAGVHCGELVSYQGRECILKNARRLNRWYAAKKSFTLSGIANNGVTGDSELSEAVKEIVLTEDCEIILCSETSEKNLHNFKTHEGEHE